MCMGDVSLYKGSEKELLLQRGTIYQINSVGVRHGRLWVNTTAVGHD